jgi:RNA polymerase sigma factor (sigma-70 family)
MAAPPPFQSFLDEHREVVLAFLIATVGPGEADDCFQETFLAALRAYPRLRSTENLRGWVLTIAHRKAMDACRARGRRPAPTDAAPEGGAADERLEHVEDGAAGLWRAASKLPPRQRAAVAHRFLADLRYREIAALVGGTEAGARRNVHDGLDRLRRELAA